jgi:beta-lactamase superfamily II metal-dependent hydrolase
VLTALESFASYFVPLDQTATGLSPIDQNHASVVIHVEISNEMILLGADLERTSSPLTGWNAVVASGTRSTKLAGIFKVPHHGSANANSPPVWAQMVAPQAIAVVTPYLRSGLPRLADIERLRSQNARIFATSLPRTLHVNRRPEVSKTTKEAAPDLVAYRQETGVVRLRKKLGSPSWHSELFGAAQAL